MRAPDPFALDFDRLEVGAETVTRGRTITEADLVSFSALTGDWHPQHSDATWAAASPFGERIAHGMLAISYAIGLLPIDPERVSALRGLRQVVFKRPVPVGATIHARAQVVDARPLSDDLGLVSLRLDVRDATDQLMARALVDVLWRREPLGDGADNHSTMGEGAEGNGRPAPALEPELSPVGDGQILI
jgi:3-hydroxybutyryl-CoA dehydratase